MPDDSPKSQPSRTMPKRKISDAEEEKAGQKLKTVKFQVPHEQLRQDRFIDACLQYFPSGVAELITEYVEDFTLDKIQTVARFELKDSDYRRLKLMQTLDKDLAGRVEKCKFCHILRLDFHRLVEDGDETSDCCHNCAEYCDYCDDYYTPDGAYKHEDCENGSKSKCEYESDSDDA
jgi:hypothetical protein